MFCYQAAGSSFIKLQQSGDTVNAASISAEQARAIEYIYDYNTLFSPSRVGKFVGSSATLHQPYSSLVPNEM
jgi:hypothetical protein